MFTWWFEYLWTTCPCWPAWSSYHFTHNLRQKAWKRECQWHYHYQYQEGLEMTCGCNYHASWLCQDQYFSVQEWNPYFVAVLQAYGIRLLFPSKCKMVLGKSSPFSFIVLALPCVQSSEEFAASALLRCTPSLSNQEYQYQTISSSASSQSMGCECSMGFLLGHVWVENAWSPLTKAQQHGEFTHTTLWSLFSVGGNPDSIRVPASCIRIWMLTRVFSHLYFPVLKSGTTVFFDGMSHTVYVQLG